MPFIHRCLVWGMVVGLGFVLLLAGCHGDDQEDDTGTITLANLNILHGFACDPPMPADGDQCRVTDRLNLLVQHIAAAGCPDIVTLQEHVTSTFVDLAGVVVGPLVNTVEFLRAALSTLAQRCDFTYQVVFDPENATGPPATLGRGIDEELILTRYPAVDAKVMALYSPLFPFFFRHVLFARLAHPTGSVDVFTTHLAAAADFGDLPCGAQVLPPDAGVSPACPVECDAAQDTVRECQAKQMVRFIEMRHNVPNPALISGDLNAEPASKTYNEFTNRGWLDSHLAAGNAECDPGTGLQCTQGREDLNLQDLEAPALNQDRRIDFIFVVPATEGATCAGMIPPLATAETSTEVQTGLFAALPNPFVDQCGPRPDAICWPSDHSGTQAILVCEADANVAQTVRQ